MSKKKLEAQAEPLPQSAQEAISAKEKTSEQNASELSESLNAPEAIVKNENQNSLSTENEVIDDAKSSFSATLKVQALRVKSKEGRFRRAGLEFSQNEIILDAANLNDEQLASIKNEPSLIVVEDII